MQRPTAHRRVAIPGVLLGLVLAIGFAAPSFAFNSVAYAPPGGFWGPSSTTGAGVFGYPGYKLVYSWNVQMGSVTEVCMQAWGFNATHPHGAWFGAGCGASGSKAIPWGNVLSAPKMRARSYTLLGAFVPWRH
jgi:hypothetical protein